MAVIYPFQFWNDKKMKEMNINKKMVDEYGKTISNEIIKLQYKLASLYEEKDDISNLIKKHGDLIKRVLEEYNYRGKNFRTIYLPSILALALEMKEDKNFKNETDIEWYY